MYARGLNKEVMKCGFCNKEIEDELNMVVEAPDGDCYHDGCYKKHVKAREEFFGNIHDDVWYNKNFPELNDSEKAEI